jgi:DNA-binding GntR family transcriptional regulator
MGGRKFEPEILNEDARRSAPKRRTALSRADQGDAGKGQMVLDGLLKQGVPVAYRRAHITARVLTNRDRIGQALDVDDPVAALEIDHVTCTAEGTLVEHSNDIFLPRSLDLRVMRWLGDMPPVPAIGRGNRT